MFADAVAVIHVAFILLVVCGVPLALLMPRFRFLMFIFIAISTFSWTIWGGCPLVIWENSFRRRYDPTTVYRGTFVAHYSRAFLALEIPDAAVRFTTYLFFVILLAYIV